MNSSKIRTVNDAISLPCPTLGELKRRHGKEWIIGYVSLWIIDLNDSANVKNKMNDVQIEFTSQRIYDKYSLKITDLTLFFRNIKEGVYGAFYETLSPEKIMEWLQKYYDQRCEYASMMSQSKNDDFSMSKDKVHPDVIAKMFEGVGEEEVKYDHEKNTIGKRHKKIVTKNLIKEIKNKSTEELKQYIVNTDRRSENYNDYIYELVCKELDIRNNNN